MAAQRREAIERTVERLIDEVGSWPAVTVGNHRVGGTEWQVGPREIGPVHAWGMVDIASLRALRDALIEEGETGVRHPIDELGETFYIETIPSPGTERSGRRRFKRSLRIGRLQHHRIHG